MSCRPTPRSLLTPLLLLIASAAPAAAQQLTLELDNDFVRAHHDRVTTDVLFDVIAVRTRANPPAKDGETHISGTAVMADTGRPLGFAAVAEIMHGARYEGRGGLLEFLAAEGRARRPVRLRGVWRLWREGGGGGLFRQGTFPAPRAWGNPTNLPHVFEIHPVTHVERAGRTISFLEDFRFIHGFPTLDDVQRTRDAFGYFERMTCRVEPGERTTRIAGDSTRFNFVQFVARLGGRAETTPGGDGTFVRADIFDQRGRGISDSEPLARDVRLVFTKGTPPEAELRKVGGGGRMRLVGFARISLTPVNDAIAGRRAYGGKFPYEIVVTSLGGGR